DPAPPTETVAAGQRQSDRDYDKADADSFPASDPPAAAASGLPDGDPGGSPSVHADGSGPTAASRPHKREGVRLGADSGLEQPLDVQLDHGHVAIAAITSCTNTSNPQVMVAAGLLARKAVARGLQRKPWVKTSLAPGSKVVTDYLDRAGL